jgi:hypothetical protein
MPMTHDNAPAVSPDTWPVLWRIVLIEADGESSVVDEVECADFARRRAAELREFGWPVRLERIAREPLPPDAPSLESARRKLRDLKRSTDS